MTSLQLRLYLRYVGCSRCFLAGMLLTGLGIVVAATKTQGQQPSPSKEPPTYRGLSVCSRPGDRCNSAQKRFDAYELPLRLPRKLKANALYESAPFYGVVLRRDSDPACDGGEYSIAMERFRVQAQTQFPNRKVFADHQCPNMVAVSYTYLDEPKDKRNGSTENSNASAGSFVAVHAGTSIAEGRSVLATARKRFPKAALHQMRVSYSWIVQ